MPNADARDFKRLVEPHLDALFRAAFRLARNKADAEDLVQETCVRAFPRVSEFDETRHVKGWLLRVLHNLFIDGSRRARRSPVATLEKGMDRVASSSCPDPNPEESTYAAQREQQLQRAWSKLERDQRALLALRAEGYGLSEIAEITGVSADSLNARLYRSRQSFARYLGEEHANDADSRRKIAE